MIKEFMRRIRLGSLDAPSHEEEFVQVGGFELPQNFNAVVDKANRMEALSLHPGWKDVLDELERLADSRLGELKEAEYADAHAIQRIADRWREAESRIRILEGIVLSALQERDMMLKDLSQKYGHETDEILGEAKVVGQMKAQLARDGLVAIDPDAMWDEDTRA